MLYKCQPHMINNYLIHVNFYMKGSRLSHNAWPEVGTMRDHTGQKFLKRFCAKRI